MKKIASSVASVLQPISVDPPISGAMSGDAEQQAFEQEVKEVQQWWSDSRWRYTRRAYTAEQIVSKRGTIKIEYPSNVQAKKLWKLVEGRFQVSQ